MFPPDSVSSTNSLSINLLLKITGNHFVTWKFQSGPGTRAKNRNSVYLLSAPPSLEHGHVVAGLGRADGDWSVFFCPPVAQLNEGRDCPFNFSALLPLFGNSDELFSHAGL